MSGKKSPQGCGLFYCCPDGRFFLVLSLDGKNQRSSAKISSNRTFCAGHRTAKRRGGDACGIISHIILEFPQP